MVILWTIFALVVVAAIADVVWKFRLVVPPEHIGWDGKQIYEAGEHWHPWQIRIINMAPRITTFGVDVMGTVSIISTERDESGFKETKDGPMPYGVSMRERTQTQQREHFQYRYVMTWQPDKKRLNLYLQNEGTIDGRLRELLRTVPDLKLKRYEHVLGIRMLWMDKVSPGDKRTSVSLGDGVEVPY
jgi:hypothetical protein